MIAPLRRRHRTLWRVLAALLPAAYVAALAARPTWPEEPAEDRERRALAAADRVDWEEQGLLLARLGEELVVVPRGARAGAPDRLLYWSAGTAAGEADRLPEDARLLGPVGGRARAFPLPADASGSLHLYSLGHGEHLGARAWPPGRSE